MVYLVGAGTGGADMITLRGLKLIQRADCLIYDRLLDDRLLGEAPAECELIYVGKAAGKHYMPQEEITALLVEKGRQGGIVVRLKGGDPYVFGRGGEEALALREAGVDFEVVPGVTSAVAGPAFAGIPVTHRETARSVHIITAHTNAGGLGAEELAGYAMLKGTLVFLMGLSQVESIAQGLIAGGMDPYVPAAVISNGGSPDQKVVSAPLRDLPQAAETAKLPSPAIILVGETAALRDKLCFLEKKPLFGKRVLITQSPRTQDTLGDALREAGAWVRSAPMIRIVPRPGALDKTLKHLGEYTHVIFSSVNTVELFMEALGRGGQDARSFAGVTVCAIGAGTAALLSRHGLRADIVPEKYSAQGLLDRLAGELKPTDRVLLPQAALAAPTLAEGLKKRCAVDQVPFYDTVEPEDPLTAEEFLAGGFHAVAFSSASAVRNFHRWVGLDNLKAAGCTAFSIGPATSGALRELGVEPVESRRGTLPRLSERIVEWFSEREEEEG